MSTQKWLDENADKVRGYRRDWYYRNKDKQGDYRRERRRNIVEVVREMKVCCRECGENHPACLSFHHRDPSKKSHNVGEMANSGLSLSKILDEIAKCDVLCENCHRKIHYMGLA